ncbi:hypothetical protein XNC1_2388 [Xenorhabdus nematophila ATCC 19061]|uniref:Uncharacterized protein n=1 Tax=Xenorhabdus nematophila (strain ATCC 19061 / DSM 3370 / CCUG 14189 / LMG 1036 / NCIMB 9965 / AN6) TaxID=406817 RepID=D3VGL1_XENNA|nr:hypothetical protein XNC1_2388 [Xenorhabdus nematophila ATCC 19061]
MWCWPRHFVHQLSTIEQGRFALTNPGELLLFNRRVGIFSFILGAAFAVRSKQNLPALFGRSLTGSCKEVTSTLHLDGGFGELELTVELRDVETTYGVVEI